MTMTFLQRGYLKLGFTNTDVSGNSCPARPRQVFGRVEDEFAREKRADSSFRYKCTQVRSLLETGVDAWFERRFRVLFVGGGGHHSDFHANLS